MAPQTLLLLASYEKSIEREGKWNKLSLEADRTNQSRMSDAKGKPSWMKALIPCTSGKVVGKGSMKAEVLFTMTDLCIDLAFETSDTGLDCDGSKHHYLFGTLSYSCARDTLYYTTYKNKMFGGFFFDIGVNACNKIILTQGPFNREKSTILQ